MRQPGFVSANLHTSLDGTRVVNYIQWRNREALETAGKDPNFTVIAKQAAAFAPHDFRVYQVVSTMGVQ